MALDGFLKQSTAVTLKVGPFVDSTDGNTEETALTISQADVRLSKNGANIAQKNEATSLTHDELGLYDCALNTTDTNTLGILTLAIHETGSLIVKHSYMVMPANVWDSFFGADKLQVHADEITAGLITAAAIATDAIDADALSANALAEIKTQVDAGFTTQIADSVPADGTIATREQALYMALQMLTEFDVSGTTLTVKKVDGSTTLMTLTLDNAASPTSITRTT